MKTQTLTLPQWLIDKQAARASECPSALHLVDTLPLPVTSPDVAPTVDVAPKAKGKAKGKKPASTPVTRVNETSELDCFEAETPCYENHSDDVTEGLDTFDFSLSIQ